MHTDSVIGPEVELSLEYYETIISQRFKLKNGDSAAPDGHRYRFRSSTLYVMVFAYLMNI